MAKEPKKVSYELVGADDPAYDLLNSLVSAFHDHLSEARIALAWNTAWKADTDGRVTLGKCRKVGDLDRDIHEYDFIVILNREFWNSFNDRQKAALLDHELMHAEIKTDEHGEPEQDERGRIVYRIRKHDIEEFADVVKRHGLWMHDLELFARALMVRQKQDDRALDLFKEGGTASGEEIGMGENVTVSVSPGFLAGVVEGRAKKGKKKEVTV